MNELMKEINIEEKIYEIGGIEVMLDSDLAELYHVETKRINEAVKNNPEKFPNRYLYRITDKEYNYLKSKISTSKGGSRKGHTAFTEQGVYMLATILKSNVATEVSIRIMDAFVRMRHYINYSKNLLPMKFLLLEEKVDINTKKIDELFDKFNPKVIAKDYILFKGEFYDAHSILLDIFNTSKEEIIIIDNYANKELLNILKELNKRIIIVSSNINEILIDKYKMQYTNITFINNNSYHDRFIIIDKTKLYHCGASFKDLGKKCFGITETDNIEALNHILDDIKEK